VVREFLEKNRVHLARILADMVDKGMLCKIPRDNYHIIPFNADLKRSDENRRAWMAGMQNIPSNQIAWIIRIPLHGSYESL